MKKRKNKKDVIALALDYYTKSMEGAIKENWVDTVESLLALYTSIHMSSVLIHRKLLDSGISFKEIEVTRKVGEALGENVVDEATGVFRVKADNEEN